MANILIHYWETEKGLLPAVHRVASRRRPLIRRVYTGLPDGSLPRPRPRPSDNRRRFGLRFGQQPPPDRGGSPGLSPTPGLLGEATTLDDRTDLPVNRRRAVSRAAR